ncbi:hypothetical protein [Asticcacaulis biprosthecium]|uniref:hypothetical protein n=1 Tax=Asticcacaulis biprosthecium TaxID=76891 RepID=UPI0012F51010|nr:hypothetical protein [Asticcacaulis biprosthecium]
MLFTLILRATVAFAFATLCACQPTDLPDTATPDALAPDGWETPPQSLKGVCAFATQRLDADYRRLEGENEIFLKETGVEYYKLNELDHEYSEWDAQFIPGGEIYQENVSRLSDNELIEAILKTHESMAIHEMAVRFSKNGDVYKASTYALLNSLATERIEINIDLSQRVSYRLGQGNLSMGGYGPSMCLLKELCPDDFNPKPYYLKTCR